MLGQLLVGYFLSQLGWRTPFLLLGLLSLLAAAFLSLSLGDPQKGGKEEVSAMRHAMPYTSPLQLTLCDTLLSVCVQALSGLVERGIPVQLPTMTFSSFLQTLCVSPTLLLLLLQTPPNTVPWGILSAHLHDLLASEAKLTMQAATSLIALFGCGAAAGGLCGGTSTSTSTPSYMHLIPVLSCPALWNEQASQALASTRTRSRCCRASWAPRWPCPRCSCSSCWWWTWPGRGPCRSSGPASWSQVRVPH